jgi:hypothetical protein
MRFLFLNQPTRRRYIREQAEGTSIPRIIHQTHRSLEAIPSDIRTGIERLRSANPGWEYRFYGDDDVARFIWEEYGPAVLAYFARIDKRYGAARADLFRYLLMYRVGGVYLDIKSTARRPLDEIIRSDDRLVLSQWPRTSRFEGAGRHNWEFAGKIDGGEFQQWHVICRPGHPYLYSVIQAVMRNIDCYIPRMHGSGRNGVLRLTGPIAYTLALLPHLRSHGYRLATGHDDLGLDYSIYPGNADHKRVFGTHYEELTVPIVRASPFRRCLSALYAVFDTLRRRFGKR